MTGTEKARPAAAVTVRAMPLADVQGGERVRVVALRGQGSREMRELAAAGLSVNRCLDVANRQAGGGILVSLEGRRLAIGAEIARAIWVRLVETPASML